MNVGRFRMSRFVPLTAGMVLCIALLQLGMAGRASARCLGETLKTFTEPGEVSYPVPNGVKHVCLEVIGGPGIGKKGLGEESYVGGYGGLVEEEIAVDEGETLYTFVDGGGGQGALSGDYGGAGGGASAIWRSGELLAVAGGGGGTGGFEGSVRRPSFPMIGGDAGPSGGSAEGPEGGEGGQSGGSGGAGGGGAGGGSGGGGGAGGAFGGGVPGGGGGGSVGGGGGGGHGWSGNGGNGQASGEGTGSPNGGGSGGNGGAGGPGVGSEGEGRAGGGGLAKSPPLTGSGGIFAGGGAGGLNNSEFTLFGGGGGAGYGAGGGGRGETNGAIGGPGHNPKGMATGGGGGSNYVAPPSNGERRVNATEYGNSPAMVRIVNPEGVVELTPSTGQFDPTEVGKKTAAKSFTLTNNSDETLTYEAFLNGANPGDFVGLPNESPNPAWKSAMAGNTRGNWRRTRAARMKSASSPRRKAAATPFWK